MINFFFIKKYLSALFVVTLLLIAGCSQEEGIGGNCHINGILVEQFYNDDYSLLLSQQAAKDEDIFLLFGN